jgi:16S rRNA (adenine1518-N6/adenine1519-N6)-dimethyltransferase
LRQRPARPTGCVPARRPATTGLRPRRRFSQHFLEPAWVSKLVDVIGPQPDDVFLEIGPGTGRLTLPLAERAARVVGVEIDRDLVARLAPRLPPNVVLIRADVLDADLPGLLRAAALAGDPGSGSPGAMRIVGNLPYKIASPILFRLLSLQSTLPCTDATVMLQREVADRLAAKPGSSDYGVLSVFVQLHASVVKLLTLPPGAFRPAPAVTSVVVRLTFRPPVVTPTDPAGFERLVRSLFMQRRKMLANALRGFARTTSLSPQEALAQAGLDPRRRPETLEMTELAGLADVFASASG